MSVEEAIRSAAANVEMEGYVIDEESKEWCRRYLKKEITLEQCINLIMKKAGVKDNGVQS